MPRARRTAPTKVPIADVLNQTPRALPSAVDALLRRPEGLDAADALAIAHTAPALLARCARAFADANGDDAVTVADEAVTAAMRVIEAGYAYSDDLLLATLKHFAGADEAEDRRGSGPGPATLWRDLKRLVVVCIVERRGSATTRHRLLDLLDVLAEGHPTKARCGTEFAATVAQELGRDGADLATQRALANVLINLVKGSAENKRRLPSWAFVGAAMNRSADFFFHIQCVELLFRVARQAKVVLRDLQPHLPESLLSAVAALDAAPDMFGAIVALLEEWNAGREPVVTYPMRVASVDAGPTQLCGEATVYFAPEYFVLLTNDGGADHVTITYSAVRSVRARNGCVLFRLHEAPERLAAKLSLGVEGKDGVGLHIASPDVLAQFRTAPVQRWVAAAVKRRADEARAAREREEAARHAACGATATVNRHAFPGPYSPEQMDSAGRPLPPRQPDFNVDDTPSDIVAASRSGPSGELGSAGGGKAALGAEVPAMAAPAPVAPAPVARTPAQRLDMETAVTPAASTSIAAAVAEGLSGRRPEEREHDDDAVAALAEDIHRSAELRHSGHAATADRPPRQESPMLIPSLSPAGLAPMAASQLPPPVAPVAPVAPSLNLASAMKPAVTLSPSRSHPTTPQTARQKRQREHDAVSSARRGARPDEDVADASPRHLELEAAVDPVSPDTDHPSTKAAEQQRASGAAEGTAPSADKGKVAGYKSVALDINAALPGTTTVEDVPGSAVEDAMAQLHEEVVRRKEAMMAEGFEAIAATGEALQQLVNDARADVRGDMGQFQDVTMAGLQELREGHKRTRDALVADVAHMNVRLVEMRELNAQSHANVQALAAGFAPVAAQAAAEERTQLLALKDKVEARARAFEAELNDRLANVNPQAVLQAILARRAAAPA